MPPNAGYAYEFGGRRIHHARLEPTAPEASILERVVNALTALAPLIAGDLPPGVERLYRDIQKRVGREYWSLGFAPGRLASRLEAMSDTDIESVIELIEEAAALVDRFGLVRGRVANLEDDPIASRRRPPLDCP